MKFLRLLFCIYIIGLLATTLVDLIIFSGHTNGLPLPVPRTLTDAILNPYCALTPCISGWFHEGLVFPLFAPLALLFRVLNDTSNGLLPKILGCFALVSAGVFIIGFARLFGRDVSTPNYKWKSRCVMFIACIFYIAMTLYFRYSTYTLGFPD